MLPGVGTLEPIGAPLTLNAMTPPDRDIQVLESHGQPADHPVSVTCPETEYLKVFICRVS